MQALRAVFASLANRSHKLMSVLQRKKQVSVDDMIVITHNLASLLITDRQQVKSGEKLRET